MRKKKNYLVLQSDYSLNSGWDIDYDIDVKSDKEIIELANKLLKEGSLEDYTDMEWIDSEDERYDEELDEDNNGGHYSRPWRDGELLEAAVESLEDNGAVYKIFDPKTELDLFKTWAQKHLTNEYINEFLESNSYLFDDKPKTEGA